MSQDNPNSQPPSPKEPQGSQSPPRRRRRTPPEQSPSPRVQPFWKTQIIKILRQTIGLLQGAVVKLETPPRPGTEETPNFFSGFLRKIRSFLPANLSAKLSDTALTGIIAGITVVLVWTTTNIFSSKSPEIATVPPVEEVPAPTPTPTPTITAPPVVETPQPEPTPTAAAEPTPEPTPTPTAEPTPEPTSTAEPTPEPTPTAEPTPEPTPTPTPRVVLTPEQILIAEIENQVAEISDRFASGLIKSIQANFRTSNLIVKISEDLYTLEKSQQDKLLAEILQRSQQLDFTHLEIIDYQDRLIARNPVVGNEIIIFQRQAK